MSGDPHECRRQAAECFRIAHGATSQKFRDDFTQLANVWLNLASQFESDNATIAMWSASSKEYVAPFNALPRRVA